MGLSYRKSVKMGPFRVTASKSGISYSAGIKGARVTKRADGKVQATVSPHGVRYTKTSSSAKRPAGRPATATKPAPAPAKTAVRTQPAAKPRQAPVAKPKRAAKPVRAAKPARPSKALKLRGRRFTVPPRVLSAWLLPCTVNGNLATVTLHHGGIHIERTQAGRITGNHSADISWQDVAAIDFLEPSFFRNGHIHFATFRDPRGLTFAGNGDPMTSSYKNPHVILFDRARSLAYKQLRDLLTGAYNPAPPYPAAEWHPRGPRHQP